MLCPGKETYTTTFPSFLLTKDTIDYEILTAMNRQNPDSSTTYPVVILNYYDPIKECPVRGILTFQT